MQNLLSSPTVRRSAGELHHLFPKAWLHHKNIKDRRTVNQVANMATLDYHQNSSIGGEAPSEYVPRLREVLRVSDAQWARACAEHALPIDWELMDYETFLRARRERMAEIIRVAYRKLGGEAEAPPVTPPWFLPGAEIVWQRILETERSLRGLVREVYQSQFGDLAAQKIERTLSDSARETLSRALRARPVAADPLSVVDYLYLGQLPTLIFAADVWPAAKKRLGMAADIKRTFQNAIDLIAPVRNEIAHVREVAPDRLQRANLGCADILQLLQTR